MRWAAAIVLIIYLSMPGASHADDVVIGIGSSRAAPGETVRIPIVMRATREVWTLQTEIQAGTNGAIVLAPGSGPNRPLCDTPNIGSFLYWPPGCTPEGGCSGFRAFISKLPVVPEQVAYTCDFIVSAQAITGSYPIECVSANAHYDLERLNTSCQNGSIHVICTGDCDRDGHVTVDEIVRGVSIALGLTPATECAEIDRDRDNTATIDEIMAAVTCALGES